MSGQARSVLLLARRRDIERVEAESVRSIAAADYRPAGIGTMDAAEALLEWNCACIDAIQSLPAGSYYHHDLIGCSVETPRGKPIGRVRAVEGDGAGSRLVVERADGDVLIPMVEGICVDIDVAGRKVVVELPEGLLDVNVTKRQRF
jgi:16S rRNA processing protein RimM